MSIMPFRACPCARSCKDDSQEMSNKETNTCSSSQQGAEDPVCLSLDTGCHRTRPSLAAFIYSLLLVCAKVILCTPWLRFTAVRFSTQTFANLATPRISERLFQNLNGL